MDEVALNKKYICFPSVLASYMSYFSYDTPQVRNNPAHNLPISQFNPSPLHKTQIILKRNEQKTEYGDSFSNNNFITP